MKFMNSLLNALSKISSNEINQSSTINNKSDNFFHNSFHMLFHSKQLPFFDEPTSLFEEITEVEYFDDVISDGNLMSDEDFLDLLPPNTYFH